MDMQPQKDAEINLPIDTKLIFFREYILMLGLSYKSKSD